jgi:hypothetical protein
VYKVLLQDRNINILDGTTVENKGKLILKYDYTMCTRKWKCRRVRI